MGKRRRRGRTTAADDVSYYFARSEGEEKEHRAGLYLLSFRQRERSLTHRSSLPPLTFASQEKKKQKRASAVAIHVRMQLDRRSDRGGRRRKGPHDPLSLSTFRLSRNEKGGRQRYPTSTQKGRGDISFIWALREREGSEVRHRGSSTKRGGESTLRIYYTRNRPM